MVPLFFFFFTLSIIAVAAALRMCSCGGSTRTWLRVRSDGNMAGVPSARPDADDEGRVLRAVAMRGGWPGTALTPAQGIGTKRTGGVRARA